MKNSKLNYIVEPSLSLYSVIETSTNQVIKTCKVYKDAKELMRYLNLGGAFDGWTPAFILKKNNNI
tara:strand:- start:1545 stop:1742 length:198 start_codon:yes stop_codon:yes gene_type:complete